MGRRKEKTPKVAAAPLKAALPGPRSITRVLDPLTASVELRERVTEVIAVQRQAVQARRGSYRAAMNPRTRVVTPFGGSGDQHVDQWSRRMLRELSRDLDRNADTYRIVNDAFASAVVGEGVKWRPKTQNPEWNKLAAAKVDAYMRLGRGGVDVRGIRSGYRILYDLVREFAVDGEMGFIKLVNCKIQCFETEQVTNGGKTEAGVVDGVIMDDSGAITAYHICPYNDTGALDYGAGSDYSADVVEWTANRSRFSQTRGTPMIVACLEDWERLDSYRESEIIAAEQGSQIYGVIEHPEGDLGTQRPFAASQADPTEVMRGGLTSAVSSGGQQVDWQPTVAGAVLDLPDGKKYVPTDPKRPNPNAVTFLMELLRQFCANVGLPYEYVYNDVRGLSWSVNRALVQMARDRIAIWQTQFFGPLISNFYNWLVGCMIEDGVIPPNPEWQTHELDWPRISWPDEGAEYEAQAEGLLAGLTTRHRVHGAQWRDILDERMMELDYASELAAAYNKKFPDFMITPHFVLGFEDKTEMIATPEPPPGDDGPGADGKAKPSAKDAKKTAKGHRHARR